MAWDINIGDWVAVIATVGKRIDDRVTLYIPTALHAHLTIDPIAKPGDKMMFEGEAVHVDEDLGRVTVQVLGRVTVDTSTVKLLRKVSTRSYDAAI